MKKGISLIVLVITIIIIIILAGAVILNLADNNPIDNANSAAVLSEQSDLNSAITIYMGSWASDQAAGYKFAVGDKATPVASNTKDANDKEIGEGFYKLEDIKITCGDQVFESITAAKLLEKVSMKDAKYAGKTWDIVMNLSGNVKLIAKK